MFGHLVSPRIVLPDLRMPELEPCTSTASKAADRWLHCAVLACTSSTIYFSLGHKTTRSPPSGGDNASQNDSDTGSNSAHSTNAIRGDLKFCFHSCASNLENSRLRVVTDDGTNVTRAAATASASPGEKSKSTLKPPTVNHREVTSG